MIHVEHLQKSFDDTAVLRGVDLDVADGETMVIIGRSGGGKSVLLKHLCGLLRPDGGAVVVDGVDLTTLSEDELMPIRKKFGVLFQGAALFDSLTLFENVAFPLWEEHRHSEHEIEERVMRALRIVGLEAARDKKPAELSGGMRKRAGLARACVAHPKYILYDEPTTGLDPMRADNINNLILRLRDHLKVTSVAVTHDMVSAYKIADRMAMLHEGRIYKVGAPQEFQSSTDPVIRTFVTGHGDIPQEVALASATVH
jgi:phospholipid/cholesterol/gamma-HCH transport system ATP-binding protein